MDGKPAQVKGDLEGSKWKWEFEPDNEKTLVYYYGKTDNFSSFLQKFEDKSKTISMGINIASVLKTLNNIKKQSERIYMKKKTIVSEWKKLLRYKHSR